MVEHYGVSLSLVSGVIHQKSGYGVKEGGGRSDVAENKGTLTGIHDLQTEVQYSLLYTIN